MNEIQSILFGKFDEQATFKLGIEANRIVLREKIYSYFKSKNKNQTEWDKVFNDQFELSIIFWIDSKKYDLYFEKKLGSLILKKNSKYDYWGVYHLLYIGAAAYNFELFNSNYLIALSLYLLVFLIIYIPIRIKEKKVWHRAIGVIEGLTELQVKE